jgi:hypothetical protein
MPAPACHRLGKQPGKGCVPAASTRRLLLCPLALQECRSHALLEGKGFLQEAPDGRQLFERIKPVQSASIYGSTRI